VLTQSGYAISPQFATGGNRSQIGPARKPQNEARLQEVRGAALLDNLTGVCAAEHRGDRRPDGLDVPVLLGGDVRDQVVERAHLLAPGKPNDWNV
jgi:hypothetical protein